MPDQSQKNCLWNKLISATSPPPPNFGQCTILGSKNFSEHQTPFTYITKLTTKLTLFVPVLFIISQYCPTVKRILPDCLCLPNKLGAFSLFNFPLFTRLMLNICPTFRLCNLFGGAAAPLPRTPMIIHGLSTYNSTCTVCSNRQWLMLERLQHDEWHKWATYIFYRWTFYVAIKIFCRTKCPANRKFCQTKPIFDFFDVQGLHILVPLSKYQGKNRVTSKPYVTDIISCQ